MTIDPTPTTDREAITEVCVRYAFALDNRDWAALRECFLPDVVSVYHGVGELNGYEAIESLCRGALESLAVSQHLLGSHLVEVRGDEAEAACYFHAQHVRDGVAGGSQFIVAGRYEDRFVRTVDGWKIAHRRQTVLWTSGNTDVLSL